MPTRSHEPHPRELKSIHAAIKSIPNLQEFPNGSNHPFQLIKLYNVPLTGGGILSTGGVGKPPGEKCLDCDGYSCCCIPCVIM
ncbi:uncharacterized protein LAJ45_01844 [Morchella importuna]|uniref:uncharacterized protein n=1 Tax=Morchella importuna TaxID=1174673 RepID=UPI001E8CFDE6|nr:uncharacterized protein LAJ45_01844 [Morchella importuna]KAH8154077.1 hypothetical protein LAJ45_01844 [Morchella importuna]